MEQAEVGLGWVASHDERSEAGEHKKSEDEGVLLEDYLSM